MRKIIKALLITLILSGCSSMDFRKTVSSLDISKFMGKWYVMAGKYTFLEKDSMNNLEEYHWNKEHKRIEITFSFNDRKTGKRKVYTQKAWIEDKKTNAFWKVQPFWPLKLDYLVIDLADDYSWTAIGVPSGKYLWIMSRDPSMNRDKLDMVIKRVTSLGYPTNGLVYTNHSK
jgi:apolipoprotein D and lipocalin family protein